MTLPSLIERVRAATGPDVALDHDLARYLDGDKYRAATWQPALTGSLETVIALVERELPDRGWCTGKGDGSYMGMVENVGGDDSEGRAPTPALALLLAFLTAKAAKCGPLPLADDRR